MPASIQHGRSANHTLRIVCPNGHLGFAPIKTGSFRTGCHCEPDLICADSGSCDVGPVPLGADISSSPLQWQVDQAAKARRGLLLVLLQMAHVEIADRFEPKSRSNQTNP
jgi:hypothetical protein